MSSLRIFPIPVPIFLKAMELFDFTGVKENKKKNDIMEKIKFIDINKLTPLEAINILDDLQNRIKSGL